MRKMRKAFSMITAIFVIVIMATIAVLVLSLSGKTIKNTTVQYRHEQAALLARSYTEMAVLAVINHDRNATGECIQDINGVVNSIIPGQTPTGSTDDGSGYNVQVRISYLGNGLPCSASRRLNDSNASDRSSTLIQTDYNSTSAADAIAAIIVDVYVQYKDPDAVNPSSSPWITYHRRTLQKI